MTKQRGLPNRHHPDSGIPHHLAPTLPGTSQPDHGTHRDFPNRHHPDSGGTTFLVLDLAG